MFGGGPGPRVRASEVIERLDCLGKITYKTAVVINKSKELLDIFLRYQGRPRLDGFYLLRVHSDFALRDDNA